MRPTGSWRALLYPGVAALALAGLPAGCADDGALPSRTLTAADTADQILEKMEHVITDDGVRRTTQKVLQSVDVLRSRQG